MKASGGPQKLRFTVHAFSGEDTDYPVRELLFHSPQTRGWQSPRFCKYPQEIVLRLEQTCKVQQIQILSHEYKIATRVEVFVGAPPNVLDTDPNNCVFKRLGYLSFDSNERSNHQARELKSVHVNVQAFLVRLLIHRCHVNKLNIYNQVGIIALNLIGEKASPPPDAPAGFLQLHPPVPTAQPYYNAAAADMADVNLDLHVDTVTAIKIRELARQKDEAVAREDYDTAKALKNSIERLKVVGQKVAQLEARKRAAVEKEDYDTAKAIKADIDKLRAAGEGAAMATGAAAGAGKNPDEIFNRVLGHKASAVGISPSGGANGVPALQLPFDEQPVGRPSSGVARRPTSAHDASNADSDGNRGPTIVEVEDEYAPGPLTHQSSVSAMNNRHQQYDERPAMGRGRYTPTEDQMVAAAMQRQALHQPIDTSLPAPPGWPEDLPAPEPVAGAVAKEAEALEDLAGEYVARAFFSKNWQLRDAAVVWLVKEVSSGGFEGKRDAFRTLVRLVTKGMRDKVANVYLSCLSLLPALVDSGLAAASGGREVEAMAEAVLPQLIDKLGDNNARLRDASKESIMLLASIKEAQLASHTGIFVKPVKNQSAWRPVLGILQLLRDLVPLVGISRSGDGFELGELMDFVGKAYNSPNADVRSEGVRVTKEVFDLVGPAIRKCMPRDINAKIKEQVDAVLGGGDAPAAAPPPPPPVAAPRAPPPRAAALPPNKRPVSGKSEAEAAVYEQELQKAEAEFGPNHPKTAEACSNLAIFYNSKELSDLALPLYERALDIYERHYGEDHPEVAHTLTDLAVLHLEQGRDDVGRPLLERALVIQEAALGPDHADVLAIKDVLKSEG
ncbi:hypothetical protein VOLCADRAFT_104552 [Volvox carteri f. nagariensis]|uniref:TOG domain-containing protein n=1 Tax=Volvox carteri f. nagariensis TaxID=3068 RepID=D8TUD8_VOLCA|nr:uncharacterized protein VOLCADRAFT_104552 [Volvox carteri f. nagariensis]EFJ48806.1 hypothetical protein VOLCADRAFT_104552 [Volvox carteri f. nagariensis]|eukprot:XP_002950138.1 hypothetical protein VOLCADRAFT_104552 [Volvox carteri f. nagariensis]